MSIRSGRWSLMIAGLFVACSRRMRAPSKISHSLRSMRTTSTGGGKSGLDGYRSTGAAGVTRFTYVIRKNGLEVIRSGTLDLSSGKGTIEEVVNEPCMIFVELTPEGAPAPVGPQRRPYASVGAAVSPNGYSHRLRDRRISTTSGPPNSKLSERSR